MAGLGTLLWSEGLPCLRHRESDMMAPDRNPSPWVADEEGSGPVSATG